ncbi:hypothetical protein FNH22_03600 [Fulvivirga sp. M361]|uniref:hypothetical protein n=1 Tax=Fulvivirga sp. M361 TaxID=2594266 RepID=UPI00117B5DFC|nr:hypothetical protein [Fulvivirga sp. M361]TRX61871.1 hypothetical protein FNH22_03600 [Fulvivirga sp. M361]
MSKKVLISGLLCTMSIALVGVTWHVVLFKGQYIYLGVYNRMDDPIYAFGFLAWILEGFGIAYLFSKSSYAKKGLFSVLKFVWLVGMIVSATETIGSAAKKHIPDMVQWILLSGGFILINYSIMGIALWMVYKRNEKIV